MIDAVIGDIESAMPVVRGTTHSTTYAYAVWVDSPVNKRRPVAISGRFSPGSGQALYVSDMAVSRKPARTAGAPPKRPTDLEAAAARQRARERAGEDEHPRKSGPARGGKG